MHKYFGDVAFKFIEDFFCFDPQNFLHHVCWFYQGVSKLGVVDEVFTFTLQRVSITLSVDKNVEILHIPCNLSAYPTLQAV